MRGEFLFFIESSDVVSSVAASPDSSLDVFGFGGVLCVSIVVSFDGFGPLEKVTFSTPMYLWNRPVRLFDHMKGETMEEFGS